MRQLVNASLDSLLTPCTLFTALHCYSCTGLQDVFVSLGWRKATDDDDWDVHWCDVGWVHDMPSTMNLSSTARLSSFFCVCDPPPPPHCSMRVLVRGHELSLVRPSLYNRLRRRS